MSFEELDKEWCIQWDPSIEDIIGNQYFVPYNSRAYGVFPVGMVCVIRVHNVAALSELSLAVH